MDTAVLTTAHGCHFLLIYMNSILLNLPANIQNYTVEVSCIRFKCFTVDINKFW